MSFLASTWPWNLPPGPSFLIAWVLLATVLVGLGLLLAWVVGDLLDGPVLRASSASTSAATPSQAHQLVVGRLPGAEDATLVAYLRGGVDAVGHVLFAGAAAAGWLTYDGTKFTVLPDVEPTDLDLAFFKATLGRSREVLRATIVDAMRQTARDLEPSLRRRAEESGVLRPSDRRVLLLAIGMGGGLVAAVVGVVRIVVRQELNPDAVFPGNLVIAMTLALALSGWLTWKFTARHRQARAMLAWLDDVTTSLRADVTRGADLDPGRVSLTAALGGLVALGAARESLGVLGLAPPTYAGASSGGSSSPSDYGSSWGLSASDSSSGSSGSSSCGGGGGCGAGCS